jgi:uncharacterized membrane protein YccC
MNIRALARRWRPQLIYSAKSVIAAVTAFALAQATNLSFPLWAALTALIVTQISVGRSLKATIDYFVGTVGGATYGGAIGILVPNVNEIATFGALALTLAPLVVVAAIKPSFAVAPITGVLVLLIPGVIHSTPLASAFDRVLEVALGGGTGLIVSLVLPLTAHRLFAKAAANVLKQMAQVVEVALVPSQNRVDRDGLNRLQEAILQATNTVVGSERGGGGRKDVALCRRSPHGTVAPHD